MNFNLEEKLSDIQKKKRKGVILFFSFFGLWILEMVLFSVFARYQSRTLFSILLSVVSLLLLWLLLWSYYTDLKPNRQFLKFYEHLLSYPEEKITGLVVSLSQEKTTLSPGVIGKEARIKIKDKERILYTLEDNLPKEKEMDLVIRGNVILRGTDHEA